MGYHQAFLLPICTNHFNTNRFLLVNGKQPQFLLNSFLFSTFIYNVTTNGMNHNSPVLLLVAEKKEIVSEHVSLEVNKKC